MIRERSCNRDVAFKDRASVKRERSGTWGLLAIARDQQRFINLEMTADWHELMIPRRIMRPSIARDSEQLDR